ncbi:toxic anion resistance protein, partial [Caulobacter sp. HMWF009]
MSEIEKTSQVTTQALTLADSGKVATIQAAIDIADTAQITAFGERAQQQVAGFADRILEQTRNRELGDTGELLSDIIAKAKGLDPADLQNADFVTRLFGGLRRRLH